jgi:hypothetical protein
MKRIQLSIVVYILWTVNGAVHAQTRNEDSIQFLYQSCKQEMAAGLPRFCLGYIEAVGQVMATNGYERVKLLPSDTEGRRYLTGMAICPGPAIGVPSGGALIQAFLNWAEQHPENWANLALAGVVVALASTWPCSN